MRRCGNVLRATILEAPDGRSKGCGLVEYSNPSEARRACDELTDADLGGRHVFVREDREAVAPPTSGSGRGAGGPASSSSTTTSVFVGNLAYEVAWQDLKDHMRGAGDVAHAEVLKQRDGRSKGCGLVEYVHYRDAQRALRELDGTTLMGRDLFVQPDERRGGGGGGFGGGGGGGPRQQGGQPPTNNPRLFVGNLSYETSWQDLKDFMREAGTVARADILQGPDGRSKGCGIVEFEHPRDAARALRELNEATLNDRTVYLREDRRKEEREGGAQFGGFGGGGGGGGGGGRGFGGGGGGGPRQQGGQPPTNNPRLFVGNLSYETSWQDLKDFMREAGTVARADILQGPDGRSKGCGIVEFEHPRDAARALRELNEATLNDRTVYLREDRRKEEREGGAQFGGFGGGGGGGGGGVGGGGDVQYGGFIDVDTTLATPRR